MRKNGLGSVLVGLKSKDSGCLRWEAMSNHVDWKEHEERANSPMNDDCKPYETCASCMPDRKYKTPSSRHAIRRMSLISTHRSFTRMQS
jgi:hypothetical protein